MKLILNAGVLPYPRIRLMIIGLTIRITIACLACFSFFKLSELVFATKYGIADKDEGLYLLAADPPNNSAAWSFPWGWHTKPIFELTSFDLSTFRAVGATVLILVSIFFVREIFQYHYDGAENRLRTKIFIRISILIIGLSFAAIFYGSFIFRTPGYNWVNYVGTLLSCTGLLKQLKSYAGEKQKNQIVSPAVLFAAGLFFTTPAKPSSPIFLFVISILFLVSNKRSVKSWIVLTISYYGVFVVLALLTRVWPMNFISILVRAFDSPVVDNDQSILGALLNILKTPSYISGNIRTNPSTINILILVLVTLLIIFLRKKPEIIFYLYPPILICVIMTSGISSGYSEILRTDNETLSIWKLSTALLILLMINTLIFLLSDQGGVKRFILKDRRIIFSVSLCILIPFITSFGSAHGILNMGSLFSAPLLVVSVLFSFAVLNSKIRVFLICSNLIFILFLTAIISLQSYQHPWNIDPPALSTEAINVGKHGAQIYVDKAFSAEIEDLTSKLVDSGWSSGQPLLGANWHIASTIPYVLGAQPPNSLMLTIYGYDNSLATLNYNLSSKFDPYPYKSAWIMTTPLNQLTASQRIEIRTALNALETKSARDFPEDYSYVTQSMGIDFWKPKS